MDTVLNKQTEDLYSVKERQIIKKKRLNIFMHCCICYGCQGVLVIMLFKQLIEDNWDQFTKIVDNIFLLMMRFICASILHLSLLDETYTAMQCMKFAVNHDYLFYDFKLAFISSFFQTTIVIGVESVNIALIC